MGKFITVKSKEVEEISEIDFDLRDNILGKNWDEEFEDEIYLGHYYDGNCPVEIDRLIEILNNFKKEGSNYVSIDYHIDHIGYIFQPHSVYVSSPEELTEYSEKVEKRRKNLEKVQKLQDKINEINRTDTGR